MKIAVHLHLYYLEQLPRFLKKLKNLPANSYDLFVTMVSSNKMIEQAVLSFNPKAKIIFVPNRGFDVGPFIFVLSQIELEAYDYVLKIHTKNWNWRYLTRLNNVWFNHKNWSRLLINSLLKSKAVVARNLKLFENNPQIGMLASSYCITDEDFCYQGLLNFINSELKKINYSNVMPLPFVAGTMFMVRAKLLKPLQGKYNIEDFDFSSTIIKDYTLAHALERMFGILVQLQGFEIQGVKYDKPDMYIALALKSKEVIQRVFSFS
jgi:lipopolysaccharide biosynthesis protein